MRRDSTILATLQPSLEAPLRASVTREGANDAARVEPRMPHPGWHVRGRMTRGGLVVRGRCGPAFGPVREGDESNV